MSLKTCSTDKAQLKGKEDVYIGDIIRSIEEVW